MKSWGIQISTFRLPASLATLLVLSGGSVLLPREVNAGILPTVTAQVPIGAKIVYVNPATGTNQANAGTTAIPYKTITYAITQAAPGTTIQLASGTYNSNSGESFPIMLKQGVTLQGDESSKGQGILITGGGVYISPTFARQNITILADNDIVISGVTVTNPNQRGTGVWVESTNPTIENCTFTNSLREGIFVTGTGNPKIINNVFVQNQGNGVSIAKSAQGDIRNNIFQDTGFGLAIGGSSTPLVVDNQIMNNQDGLYISESARPILRQNVIENNKHDGLVATVNALPDLGTNSNPGSNILRNNAHYDLDNATKSNRIVAIGNDINRKHIFGAVDFVAATVNAAVAFQDVPPGYWAKAYIEALAAKNIIAGFPDGNFKPDEPVTRAQFATIVTKALAPAPKRPAIEFRDVSGNFWARKAIESAYQSQFVSGYPDGTFNPNQEIPRVQVLVSLANGLGLTADNQEILGFYTDAAQIPSYADSSVAAATIKQLVIDYPNVKQLDPNRQATRAEVAAFVYQALVNAGRVQAVSSPYLVKAP